MAAAIGLLTLKSIAYYLTNSLAIYSDALESIANVVAAGFALYALHISHSPADKDHPYGHGKIEFISAGFEGSMMFTAATVAMLRALDALIRKPDLRMEGLTIGLLLLLAAIAVNGLVGGLLLRVGRRATSPILEADGLHLISDAVTSLATVAALLLVRLTAWRHLDAIAGLLVAAYFGRIGARLMASAVGGLMDRQDEADQQLLATILDRHIGPGGQAPRICGYHKLRHRHSGRYHWVDFHIHLPPELDISTGHRIASDIEDEIIDALGIGDATAHIEPCNGQECAHCSAKRAKELG